MPLSESQVKLVETLKETLRTTTDLRVPVPRYSHLMTQAHRFNRSTATGFGAQLQALDGSFVTLLSKPPHFNPFLKLVREPDDHYRLIIYRNNTGQINRVNPADYQTTGGTYGEVK